MSSYPTAEEMIARGDNSRLHIHRSFRSSLRLIFFIAVSIVGVLYGVVEHGDQARYFALIPVGLVLQLVWRFLNDLYIVKRDSVVHQQGRVSLRYAVPSIRCVDLRAISVEQTLLGRILNYGNLSLATAAQSGPELTMTGVVDPQELSKLIDDLRVLSQRAALDDQTEPGSGRLGND